VFPLQIGVAARVMLLGFIFLLVCIWVTACFLVRWFGDVVFGGHDVWWWLVVVVGVISFRSNLCYTGPCSSSLALVCAFMGGLGVYGVWGCVSRCVESCPFDLFVI